MAIFPPAHESPARASRSIAVSASVSASHTAPAKPSAARSPHGNAKAAKIKTVPPRHKITLLAALLLTAFASLAATITPPANAATISKTASGDFSAPAHLASVSFVCNSRQALGKTRIATTEGVCVFSYGKEADQLSRLNYYGYRYYDPLSLTWTQADPLFRFVPDIAYDQPRLMSLYAFSLNNPVRYADPDGRMPWDIGSTKGGQSLLEANAVAASNRSNGQNLALVGIVLAPLAILAAPKIAMAALAIETGADVIQAGAALQHLVANPSMENAAVAALSVGDVLSGPGIGAEAATARRLSKPSEGQSRSVSARDTKLAEIRQGSGKEISRNSTVVGVHDPATGNVAVGVKRSGCDHGKCAEDMAADALPGSPDPKTLEFTPVIRPRTDKVIDRCDRCTETYGPEE